jgi:hypothetical protein
VTLPGPPGVVWPIELLLWAAGAVLVGELVRGFLDHWIGSWWELEIVERTLLDLYLGGAAVFLLAALPFGAFVLPVLVGLPVAAGVLIVMRELSPRLRRVPPDLRRVRPSLPGLIALLSAAALFAFELAIALPVGTGNTYDSSVLVTFVAVLLRTHSIPLTLAPYASVGVLYPQGTTVWLGWAQTLFGLPPARTPLLVTPLFLALAPLGAFVFGRRAFGSDAAGAACAVFFAAVGSWTRVLVTGSNDFVLAFPLVLVLAGQLAAATRGAMLRWPDAIGFGLLAGYSAALNPVGAEWLVPSALLVGAICWARGLRDLGRWLARWTAMLATALLALVPTIYVLVLGWSSPTLTPGGGAPPAGTRVGIDGAQFLGSIDPYLFRPTDVWLSPLPLLRAELAVLLTVGLVVLMIAIGWTSLGPGLGPFVRFVVPSAAVMVGWLALLWAGSAGGPAAARFAAVSSGPELSIWLFTLYTFVAVVPLVLLVGRALERPLDAPDGPSPADAPARRPHRGRWTASAPVAVAVALVIVVPGAVLSGTSLPPVLHHLYTDVGNVSSDDLALLEYAGAHLPAGARVLVAPGSAAEFLPGYDSNVRMLYPMVPGWPWINRSYTLVVRELTNGTLDASGLQALGELDVGYILVTAANTVLWPPFSPAPLLAEPSEFPVEFHAGDAYEFARASG